MFDLSRLLVDIERRARSLRGLRAAAVALTSALGVSALLAVGRWARWIPLTRPAVIVAIASAWALGTVVFLFARGGHLDLPRLLLRVDLASGTSERLAALLELRERGEGAVFRRRLEAALEAVPIAWKRGLPIERLTRVTLLIALLACCGAVVFVLLPARGSGASSTVVTAIEPPPGPLTASPASDAGTPSDVRTTPADALSTEIPSGGGTDPPPLDDALRATLDLDASEITLGPADGAFDELLGVQSTALSQLGEALEALGAAGEGLSDTLRDALEEIAEGLPDSSLRDALEELLDAQDPQSVEEQLSELQDLLEEEAEDTQAGDDGRPPTPGQGASSEDLWTPPEPDPDELSPDGPRPPSGERHAGDGEGERENSSDASSPFADDRPTIERMLGGTEGLEDEGETYLEPREPAFYETEVQGEIGIEGEFDEFVTRGVPLEPAVQGGAAEGQYIVDYDALRAILDQRGVDPADRELVRRYFEAVTQGGT